MTRKGFASRQLRQRIVALAVAYALALTGVLASFGAARAAAAAIGTSAIVTCHSDDGRQQAPSGDQPSGARCDDSCCLGCLTLIAALPPLPAAVVGRPQSPLSRLAHAAASPADDRQNRSHQSRAPPRA